MIKKAEEATNAETSGAEAPKPTRRRRTTTKAKESEAGSLSTEASVNDEKPKRRTRVQKSEEPVSEGSVVESAETMAEPAKKTSEKKTTRTAAKKSSAKKVATEDKVETLTEETRPEEKETPEAAESKEHGSSRTSIKVNKTKQHANGGAAARRQRRAHQQAREVVPSVSKEELAELKLTELRAKATELELDTTGLKKADLVEAIFEASAKAEGFVEARGILDILADGYGFLRTQGYLPSETDVYVGLSTIRRNGLRKGDYIVGQTRPARDNEKYAALQKIMSINGKSLEESHLRPKFADLTPVYPDERLLMEHGKNTITARVIDLTAPIGKGQRGLIVSPPKAGKTTILKDIAASITANNPEVHLMCLLVDERPEEVTDMERSVKGEVVSSTFDMPCENHIAVAELVIERAKRLVEVGQDVVILLDSITRLARAYNLAQPASGRILSGGVDSTALYPPKRFLGAARNIEGGGSLTILASALIDTGSKMDEVIFEEFKGTGNMELKLDRNLADRRIFPAIDPVASGTRKEDLLLNPQEAPLIWAVRRILANLNNTERAMDMLIKSLKQTDNNQEFLMKTAKKAQHRGKLDENFEL